MVASGATGEVAGTGTYVLASWLFLRVLGLIYLVAFVSLVTQIKGLVGREGILPIAEALDRRRAWGLNRFYRFPTLCWFNSSDSFLQLLAWSGAGLSVLLIIGFAPVPILFLLWCLLTRRDWQTAARDMGLFMIWLKRTPICQAPVPQMERPSGPGSR